MIGHRVRAAARTAAVALSFLFIFANVVLAQDRQAQGSFTQGSFTQGSFAQGNFD
jgi:hypothetical protein